MIDLTNAGWTGLLQEELRAVRTLMERLGVTELATIRVALQQARDERTRWEVGLDERPGMVEPIARVRARIEAIALRGDAVLCGRPEEATTEAGTDLAKLMLRAYNAEAERLVQTMRPEGLATAVGELTRARDAITRLGRTMAFAIAPDYHRARVDELQAAFAQVVAAVADEEEELEDARRTRETADALRELRAVKANLLREWTHYERVRLHGDVLDAAEAATKLTSLAQTIRGIEEREVRLRGEHARAVAPPP